MLLPTCAACARHAAEELDDACERFLATQFGCKIDFCCEEVCVVVVVVVVG